MIVLETTISNVHRNRDFGMIEANVTFFAKTQAGQPPHPVRIWTHVPVHGAAPLRDRLIGEAVHLATALGRRGATIRTGARVAA